MQASSNIGQAVAALQGGQLAVFNTDTVVGLGLACAHAPSPQALYRLKGRKPSKPVAWLVGGLDALDAYGANVPDYCRNLVHAFWPGALTCVVGASDAVPAAYRSDAGTIALRMPAHASCLELVRRAGPLAATSANVSGNPAPASFAELDLAIAAGAFLFDDGTVPSGVASTVVDCTGDAPHILRQGSIAL